jgi:hypothetical protein
MSNADYAAALKKAPLIEKAARSEMKQPPLTTPEETLNAMEFILEGLHQNFLLTKTRIGRRLVYTDTVSEVIRELEA